MMAFILSSTSSLKLSLFLDFHHLSIWFLIIGHFSLELFILVCFSLAKKKRHFPMRRQLQSIAKYPFHIKEACIIFCACIDDSGFFPSTFSSTFLYSLVLSSLFYLTFKKRRTSKRCD